MTTPQHTIDVPTLTAEYQARTPLYEHLEGEALYILKSALVQSNIKFHSITSRLKELDSFLDKAQRKELKNPLDEIHDVVGLRVVCLLLSDIERIGSLVRASFAILGEDDKVEGTEVSSFGYMSVHFIAEMKSEFVGPRYDRIADMAFEIQVRTIAMDAWANVSHYLEYKSDEDVPSELRRDFYALSGLFYVADKHFEMFYGSKKQSQETMAQFFEAGTPEANAQQEINLDSLSAYLQAKFPYRSHADSARVSQLVSELISTGYHTIADVDEIVETAAYAFARFEKENPIMPDGKFADTGAVRISAAIVNENYVRESIQFGGPAGEWSESEKEEAIQEELERYSEYRQMLNSGQPKLK
jgi:putative GTP pyrophosphokinase